MSTRLFQIPRVNFHGYKSEPEKFFVLKWIMWTQFRVYTYCQQYLVTTYAWLGLPYSIGNLLGIFKKLLLIFFSGALAWAYQATRPPPPKICGSPDGPPITSPRIKLRDGRHLSYLEFGVPKDIAEYKIIFVHGFANSRHHNIFASSASPVLIFHSSHVLWVFCFTETN